MSIPILFSDRVDRSGHSPISYLMEQGVANPGIISLAAGLVDQASLPVVEVERALKSVLSELPRGRRALQYGTTDGDAQIRERLVGHLAAMDGKLPTELGLAADRIIVGTGSQQLLYLVAEILLNPGDIVLLGVPSYFVYMGALENLSANIIPVATDDEGIVPESLEDALETLDRSNQLERVKFIYDVSYFNNPTGLSLSAARRRAVVQLAKRWSIRHRIFVLEDAAYRELRYHGDDIPSMLTFDPDGETVIYAGTFSKPFAPGLKTGYAVVPRSLRAALIVQKGHHDFGTSNFTQQLLAETLENGDYYKHLGNLRQTYRIKLEATLSALNRELASLAGRVSWTKPSGGLYVWVRLPKDFTTGNSSEFFARCLTAGVLVVPGEYCYPKSMNNIPRNYFRLSFGHQPVDVIEEGIRRLGTVLRAMLLGGDEVRNFADS